MDGLSRVVIPILIPCLSKQLPLDLWVSPFGGSMYTLILQGGGVGGWGWGLDHVRILFTVSRVL